MLQELFFNILISCRANLLRNACFRISISDLCIARAGASTIFELIKLNKPSILVPLPSATNNHQYYNVKFYEDRGCCWLIEQKNFTVKNLFKLITDILTDKSKIGKVQDNMKKFHFDKTTEKIHLNIQNLQIEKRARSSVGRAIPF